MNVEALIHVMGEINEENYDQRSYDGPQRCIAGHLVTIYHESLKFPAEFHVAFIAQQILDISFDQANSLFAGDWDYVWDGRFTQLYQDPKTQVLRAKARIAFFILSHGTDNVELFKMNEQNLNGLFPKEVVEILSRETMYLTIRPFNLFNSSYRGTWIIETPVETEEAVCV
jgi:hypothetical protein